MKPGFTLIEVLIASAATVALSSIALAALGGLAERSVRLSHSAAINADARAALERAVDEVQSGHPVAGGVSVAMITPNLAEITVQRPNYTGGMESRTRRVWIPVAATP